MVEAPDGDGEADGRSRRVLGVAQAFQKLCLDRSEVLTELPLQRVQAIESFAPRLDHVGARCPVEGQLEVSE